MSAFVSKSPSKVLKFNLYDNFHSLNQEQYVSQEISSFLKRNLHDLIIYSSKGNLAVVPLHLTLVSGP